MNDNEQKFQFRHLDKTIPKFIETFNTKITKIKQLMDNVENIDLKDIEYNHFVQHSNKMRQIHYDEFFK